MAQWAPQRPFFVKSPGAPEHLEHGSVLGAGLRLHLLDCRTPVVEEIWLDPPPPLRHLGPPDLSPLGPKDQHAPTANDGD